MKYFSDPLGLGAEHLQQCNSDCWLSMFPISEEGEPENILTPRSAYKLYIDISLVVLSCRSNNYLFPKWIMVGLQSKLQRALRFNMNVRKQITDEIEVFCSNVAEGIICDSFQNINSRIVFLSMIKLIFDKSWFKLDICACALPVTAHDRNLSRLISFLSSTQASSGDADKGVLQKRKRETENTEVSNSSDAVGELSSLLLPPLPSEDTIVIFTAGTAPKNGDATKKKRKKKLRKGNIKTFGGALVADVKMAADKWFKTTKERLNLLALEINEMGTKLANLTRVVDNFLLPQEVTNCASKVIAKYLDLKPHSELAHYSDCHNNTDKIDKKGKTVLLLEYLKKNMTFVSTTMSGNDIEDFVSRVDNQSDNQDRRQNYIIQSYERYVEWAEERSLARTILVILSMSRPPAAKVTGPYGLAFDYFVLDNLDFFYPALQDLVNTMKKKEM